MHKRYSKVVFIFKNELSTYLMVDIQLFAYSAKFHSVNCWQCAIFPNCP